MTLTQIFRESLDLTEATLNTERRQIQGVVLIRAGMSKNRRFYSESVLQRDAHIFEGSKSFDNHVMGSRSIRDITGWYTNVRYNEGKLIADRHFTSTAAGNDAWAIAQEVMRPDAPKNLAGLSINAVGTAKKHATEEGALEIESITAALSVDDVSEAAAGGSYREGVDSSDLTTAFWEAVTYDEYQQAKPDFIERLKKEWKTTRQDDALKAALAESEHLQAVLNEAQDDNQMWHDKHDAVMEELLLTRRELAVDHKISGVNIPADWKKPLRETLLKADESGWASIIETEENKAKSAGHRISVSGAGQQVNPPLKEAPKPKNAPYDMSKVTDPDKLFALLREESTP